MNDILLYEKVYFLKSNSQIKVLDNMTHKKLSPHWHEHYELLFFLSGDCNVVCNEHKNHVKAGDLIVVNTAEVHSFETKNDVKYVALIISPLLFGDLDFKTKLIENYIPNDARVKEHFEAICQYNSSCEEGSDIMLKSCVFSLFAYLVKEYSIAENKEYGFKIQHQKRMDKVIKHIALHYNEDISTAFLAKMSYVTENYFCRYFKNVMGVTVSDYITEFRIKKASILLENTDISISSVAENVGYSDPNYFAKLFKRKKGVTPTEYRLRANDKEEL